jgi:alkylation response protein AidB-like acyl-CoA dehydrogenase
MDFSFDEAHGSVRDLARKILGDLATNERHRRHEASGEACDRELWQALAAAHLLGVAIDEPYGGSGLPLSALLLLLEEVGRAVAPVPVLPSLALGALPLARFGSDAQKRRWLPRVTSGESVLTGALAEAGHADPLRPTARARRDGAEYRLAGEKICVPAACLAERILVPARADDGIGIFLLDPRAEGVQLTDQAVTSRQPHSRLLLDGARVPADAVLCPPGAGAAALAWWVERSVVAYCAVQLGVSERALAMTAEYAAGRIQFERPIGSFQAVHQRAADAYIALQGMRLTCWDAAWRLTAEEPAADAVAVAKYWAAEGGQLVGYAAQHLHGGIGIDVDYPLHRYYLWAKQIELALGSAPLQLERLGARLADGSLVPGAAPA